MPKWVQMGYYWVIGFNPLGSGLGWVIEGGTQNPMGWVLGRRLRPKMGSAEVYSLAKLRHAKTLYRPIVEFSRSRLRSIPRFRAIFILIRLIRTYYFIYI
jgi:hypothetical protein